MAELRYRINYFVALILLFCSTDFAVGQECSFPDAWQRTWWEGSTATTVFTSNTVQRTSSITTVTSTCQDFFEPIDQWRYFVSTSSDPDQCNRVYQDTNLLVFMTGVYNGVASPYDAESCEDPDLYTSTDTAHIFVDNQVTVQSCFDGIQGTYFTTFDVNTTLQNQCSGDLETSRVVIADTTFTMDTCATSPQGAILRNNKVLTCVGTLPALYIGNPTGNDIVIFRDSQFTRRYYCARIRSDIPNDRVYLSLAMTAAGDDGVNCLIEATTDRAETGATPYRALNMKFLYCEPDHGCLNGGTCVEPAVPPQIRNREAYTCACPDDYTGTRCETFLYCSDSTRCTAETRGTCREAPQDANGFECDCFDGYDGERCETALICVLEAPYCQNGGTCLEGPGDTATCDCPPEYTGETCEEALICVIQEPYCMNEGTCSEVIGDTATCSCPDEYTGDRCETLLVCVDEPNYCQNGATCNEATGDVANCLCDTGYEGDRCQTPLVCVLQPNYCENGECMEVDGVDAECICPAEYEGDRCETLLVCVQQPNYCQNGGTCNEEDGDTASCTCPPGFTGSRCEIQLYCEPTNPCLNGATCSEANDGQCECPTEYIGVICETLLVCVRDDPYCENSGTCNEETGDVASCTCPNEYEGDRCETLLVCVQQPNYCQNGGTCEEAPDDVATCVCPDEYTGDRCETLLVCVDQPDYCDNGATCNEEVGDVATCTCQPGFTGSRCETQLYCEPIDPCLNGATCSEANGGECICPPDYTGDTCETFLYCYSEPCENNQPCFEVPGNFFCNCSDLYEGTRCELDIRCIFPTAWQHKWYLRNDFLLEFGENQMFELSSPNTVSNTLNCEDYKESDPQGLRYYARSDTDDIDTETCTRGYQTTYLFLHWEDATIQDAEPPTAEFCENNGVFEYPPDIYVRYPFVHSAGECFDFTMGQFQVEYSRSINNQGLCADNDNSLAFIGVNEIQFSVCNAGGSEPILTQTLQCVGIIPTEFIDPNTENSIVFQLKNSDDTFYCGRIRKDTNDLRLYLSVDLTPTYNNITCLRDVSSATAVDTSSLQMRAFKLKQMYCFSGPCLNGGTCIENDGAPFTCNCVDGYTGEICETDIDECASDPCQNGGTCIDYINEYSCSCALGYYGESCEFYNPCVGDAPCLNGAACDSEASNTYFCDCLINYEGTNCETEVFCYSNPCFNSGNCTDLSDTFLCTCPSNFIGTRCETELFCASAPCQNGGACSEVDPGNGYTCQCPDDYIGVNCETQLMCFPGPCLNGATCNELLGDEYECDCPPNFTGDICETELFCEPTNPCQNGAPCLEDATTYRCNCPTSPIAYTGQNCETRLFCVPTNPCLNGGTCAEVPETISSPATYRCRCPPGFSGDDCAVEGDCGFPNSWQDVWYVKDDEFVEFTDNKVYYRQSESGLNDIASYHCEDYLKSTGQGDWWYYVRSPLEAPNNELCVQVHQDNNIIVHSDSVQIAQDPPEAEDCETFGNYTPPADILIRYPFDFASAACFTLFPGQYYAKVTFSQGVAPSCGNEDQQLYSSKAVITENTIQMDTCENRVGEPLRNVDLECVGLLDARYIGDPLTDPVIVLAEYPRSSNGKRRRRQTDQPTRFYCGRIRNSLDDDVPRVYFSIDVSPSDQVVCGQATANFASADYRAFELMRVWCEPDNPCMNGGACRDDNGNYTCECTMPYSGRNCEDFDGCDSSPCLNEGTCNSFDLSGNYNCTCAPGFTGVNCETDLFCEPDNPCMNGATCNDDTDTCGCAPGFTGDRCETDLFCEPMDPCQNGATCNEMNDRCDCEPGYTGDVCETDFDECSSSPCINGATCEDDVNSYSCDCRDGYSGTNCQFVDGCRNNPCQNGGICSSQPNNEVDEFGCECAPGYTGDRCETNINECASNPCMNSGTCRDEVNSYTCDCSAQYTGALCEVVDGCHSQSCSNVGACSVTDNQGAFLCTCDGGHTGNVCETQMYCFDVNCQNGGTCVEATDDFECNCKSGHSGRYCQDDEFNWLIFGIVVGVIAGLVVLALLIWGICWCIRMDTDSVEKQRPQSFVQAFPVGAPAYIASAAPTVIEAPNNQLAAVTYAGVPSLYNGNMNGSMMRLDDPYAGAGFASV